MRLYRSLGYLVYMSLVVTVCALAVISCAVVQQAPQKSTKYATTEYKGQVSSSARQELNKEYPSGFWKDEAIAVPAKDRLRVGVNQFSSPKNMANLSQQVADIFFTTFIQSGAFDMYERAKLEKLVAEHELSQTGLVDPSKAKEIGRLVGIDVLIVGSLSETNSRQRIDVRVIDIQTGQAVLADRMDRTINPQNTAFLARKLINKMVERYYVNSSK
ncbi:MAG: hypothetical protein HQ551_11865 [Desulfobacteraceae bacterium]|nr:hypothetical protein [Desulfobacteraceae bacterium]